MARPLTNDEITRMHHLDEEGASDKVIADQICREFNRETLDRSTIHRHRQRFPSLRKKLSPMHLPVTPLQQEAFERCQVRSEEYPDGDHGWMERGERFVDCYSPTCVSAGEYPTGELIVEAYGKRTTTRTCWFCRFTTEPKDEWGQVWVVAA